MKNQNTRNLLYIIIVVVASLGCGLSSRFISKGVEIEDEEFQSLNNNVAGEYETGDFANLSEMLVDGDLCDPPAYWSTKRTETLRFEDNKLIISDKQGTRTYMRQDFGDSAFCRELDENRIECISPGTQNEYSMSIYEDKSNPQECFFGTQALNRVDTPQTTENQLDDDEVAMSSDQNNANEDVSEEGIVQSQPESEAPQANDERQDDNQVGAFSIDDCSCEDVNLPLQADTSRVSNDRIEVEIKSGEQVETTGHLFCNWESEYQSENVTGRISIRLDVSKFDKAQYAQTFFAESRNDIESKPPYCEEDNFCTVAVADFGDDRAYYVEKEIFVRGLEEELPSTHGAYLARLITATENHYVLDLLVTHPEQEMVDDWVVNKSQAIEACVLEVIR